MVGILFQPPCLDIKVLALLLRLLELLSKIDSCPLQDVAKYSINFFCFPSLTHLVLITAERYISIKYIYSHSQTLTKTRVLMASASAWIFAAALHAMLHIDQLRAF